MNDLRDFLALLEQRGELKVVDATVDPVLELTEIADRFAKAGGPALLFRNPVGSALPVLVNQFGSDARMLAALRASSYDALGERVKGLFALEAPLGMMDKLRTLGRLKDVASFMPKSVKSGPCQEVVARGDEVDLGRLPVLQCWPHDGGRFITLPLVFTRDPVTGRRNAGMYRLQVYDRATTGMHFHLHKDAAQHFRAAAAAAEGTAGVPGSGDPAIGAAGVEAGQRRLEVAVAIGTDPAVTYAATAPLPPMIDEMMLAGFLRGTPVEMVRCLTVELEVPAHAEIVLEGYVDLDERRREGPFGDHTGYYSLADQYPVLHVTAMTHRRDAIYATTIVGRPPMEDGYLAKATERLFLPLLQLTLPEVVDMDLPEAGVFHNCAVLAIRKSYPQHARKVMHAVWGMGQMQFTKTIVVVDADVDVHDYAQVAWRAFNNVDPARDVVVTQGPLDALDHSAPQPYWGAKMGIDATRTWRSEGHLRDWPADVAMSADVIARVDARWAEFGLGALVPSPSAAAPAGGGAVQPASGPVVAAAPAAAEGADGGPTVGPR